MHIFASPRFFKATHCALCTLFASSNSLSLIISSLKTDFKYLFSPSLIQHSQFFVYSDPSFFRTSATKSSWGLKQVLCYLLDGQTSFHADSPQKSLCLLLLLFSCFSSSNFLISASLRSENLSFEETILVFSWH